MIMMLIIGVMMAIDNENTVRRTLHVFQKKTLKVNSPYKRAPRIEETMILEPLTPLRRP